MYSVKERYNKELACSRFVGELLLDKEKLIPGVKVDHKTYGPGEIKENKQGRLVIYFERLKKDRILDLDFCVQNMLLTIIEETQ